MKILAPHVIGSSSDAIRLLRAGAGAAKIVSAYDRAMDYRAAGASLIIARAPAQDDLWRSLSPQDYYETVIAPHQRHPANVGIDAWETVNEDYRKSTGETPDYADIARRAGYESELARLIAGAGAGHKPVIGNWAVGTPSGTRAEQAAAWRAYHPALETAARLGGYVGLHLYYSVPGWEHPLETLIAHIADMSPRPRILISECGREPGYRSDGYPPERYADELIAWAERVERDYPQILAAFVFTFGSTWQWRDYDVQGDETLVSRLCAAYSLLTHPPSSEQLYRVTATALNVRAHPWTGVRVPPIVRRLSHGERVRVYAAVRFSDMPHAWGLISAHGDEWVSMRWLTPAS